MSISSYMIETAHCIYKKVIYIKLHILKKQILVKTVLSCCYHVVMIAVQCSMQRLTDNPLGWGSKSCLFCYQLHVHVPLCILFDVAVRVNIN